MIIVKHKDELRGTSRAVETKEYATTRFLLREDGVGMTVTDVTLKAGIDATIQYKNHVEVCYCLEGEATLEDFETGQIHRIRPGTLWALPKHERHRFTAKGAVRLVSIFVPALVGAETWDEDGSFPLLP
ncbi:MAG: ectoine synthase [Alphaproteobacteria bacterium]